MKKPKKRILSLKRAIKNGKLNEKYIEKRIDDMFRDFDETGRPIELHLTK